MRKFDDRIPERDYDNFQGLARSLGAAVIYNQDKPWDDHKNWDHQMLRFQLIERATYSTNYREEIQKFKGLRLVIQISATGRLSIFNFYPIDGIGNYHAWNLNSGSVPSANSRLSPLPPELFNHQATIDIPLHNAKDGKAKYIFTFKLKRMN
ncbi:hypothetical protein JHK82_024440 [Glycine max]|nr:hypothetical protein JHK85_025031 [Glycine max]KAG5133252.1 hypothetical protein JHK82_024440 [Glycine max]